ncbi:MAG: hypothetical protein LBU73_07695 [Helicobacteraceae bacterium]|jgi:hypothetical protein|nr:hypothetical protein [Helicobacteraceae bacterium]
MIGEFREAKSDSFLGEESLKLAKISAKIEELNKRGNGVFGTLDNVVLDDANGAAQNVLNDSEVSRALSAISALQERIAYLRSIAAK